jgi:hypothetical protein
MALDMTPLLSDADVGHQIIDIFRRHKVTVTGSLRRIHFFEVRDGDFQRGIDWSVRQGWIARHHRDRSRYILTEAGYAAAQLFEQSLRATA